MTRRPASENAAEGSYRVRRGMNTAALTELVRRLRAVGLATGDAGFNLDLHAIRHHGDQARPAVKVANAAIDGVDLVHARRRLIVFFQHCTSADVTELARREAAVGV